MKKILVKQNSYFDSVTLMSLGAKLSKADNVTEAVVLMGTEMNRDMIISIGFDKADLDKVTENDLVVAVIGDTLEVCEDTINLAIETLNSSKKKDSKGTKTHRTIESALEDEEDINVCVISVPGEYAFKEVKTALDNNLHVMLFSDNMSIEQELMLKEIGRDKGLLVMGPDCGTSIINQVGLCFANSVSKGNIGIVAASGTGLQEVSVIINRIGGGISQAIGTGGRDLNEKIGGIMMIESIKALNEDDATEVIVLVSKPPAKSVEEKVMEAVKNVTKPVVICFIDHKQTKEVENVYYGENLADTAYKAVQIANKTDVKNLQKISDELKNVVSSEHNKLNENQKYIRGLFCGGTLCAESLSILRDHVGTVYSNVAKKEEEKLKDITTPVGHTLLDLGDDFFTNGKPHPMIEPKIRLEKIIEESKKEDVGVIILDFELGYGSSEDPVGVTIDTIIEAREDARKDGREIVYIAYVCGTPTDFQGLKEQEEILRNNGILVTSTNAEASYLACSIMKGESL